MFNFRKEFTLSIILSLLMTSTCLAAGDAELHLDETLITIDPAAQFDASISGRWITYTDSSQDVCDIFAVDSDGAIAIISYGLGCQDQANIDGNNIVFVDSNPQTDLFLFVLSDTNAGTVPIALTNDTPTENNPVISGDVVVYQKSGQAYMFDLSSMIETQLSNGVFASDVTIDGDLIAWQDFVGGTFNIVVTDLSGGMPQTIAGDGVAHELTPSVSGRRVAYNTDGDVAFYDMDSGVTTSVTADTFVQDDILISGDLIFWVDGSSGSKQIYMYDIPSAKKYQLTFDGSDKFLTDVDGCEIVYHDRRFLNLNVWSMFVDLNYPPVADAGDDVEVSWGTSVMLDGSASSDMASFPGGCSNASLTYQWTLNSGPMGAEALVVDVELGEAELTFNATLAGDWVWSLVVDDGLAMSAEVEVTVSVSENEPPNVVLNATPLQVNIGEPVAFDASLSIDPEGEDLSFTWDFGDGEGANGDTSSHSYTDGGSYLVMLEVSDGDNVAAASVVISVLAPNTPPRVSLSADPVSGEAPLIVQFSVLAEDDENDTLTYSWDFGGGAFSELESPQYTYPSPGNYVAQVTVSDGEFDTSKSIDIAVSSDLSIEVVSARVKSGKPGKVKR